MASPLLFLALACVPFVVTLTVLAAVTVLE